MTTSEEVISLIELIPLDVKIAHIASLVNDLKNRELFTDDLKKKSHLVLNFLSKSPPSLGNDPILKKLLEASFDYLWLTPEKNLVFCRSVCSLIGAVTNTIYDNKIVALCFLKNLQLVHEKCSLDSVGINEDEIIVYILVLDSIIESASKKELLISDIYCELSGVIESLLKFSVTTSNILLFLVTFKKVLRYGCDNRLLKNYWQIIKKQYFQQRSCEHLERIMFVLCFLADSYIVCCQSPFACPLHNDTALWEIIQAGLIDNTPLIRKQSLYLLKRYISVLDEQSIDSDCKLFRWKNAFKKETLEYWNTYFIIWEALEEKQIHLIMPALNRFETIIEISSKRIVPLDWMYCIFIFCFKSDSVSIIKSSIIMFCKVDVELLFCSDKYKTVIYYFFNAINNIALYSNNPSSSDENITDCLGRWFQVVGNQNNHLTLFHDLISVLSEVNLTSVPIFFLMKEIKKVSWKIEWDVTYLRSLKKLTVETSRGQNVKIRGAVQSLILLFIASHPIHQNLCLKDLADFLIAFPRNESLKRGTKCWASCVEWLRKYVPAEKVRPFLDNSCKQFKESKHINSLETVTLEALARMIMLLEDASLVPEFRKIDIFDFIFNHFSECDKRLYIGPSPQNLCFNFICHLLIECIPCGKNAKLSNKAIALISSEFDSIMTFLCMKLKTVNDVEDLDTVNIYLLFVETVLCNHRLFFNVFQNFTKLHNLAADILRKEKTPAVQEYFALKFEALFYEFIIDLEGSVCLSKFLSEDIFMTSFYTRLLNESTMQKNALQISTNKKQIVGRLVSGNIQSLWLIFYNFLIKANHNSLERINEDDVFRKGLEALNTGGKENIIYVLQVFKLLLPHSKNRTACIQIFATTWETCFEYRKTDLFWKAIDRWISAVFQECTLIDPHYHAVLINYSSKILTLGNDIFGLINLLVEGFYNLRYQVDVSPFADFIVSCLLFGPLLHKDQRIEREVCDCVERMGDDIAINILMPSWGKSNVEVRILSLNIILDKNTVGWNNLVKQLVHKLMQSYRESCRTNRYFNDSLVHRKRNRILQILLTLHCIIVNDFYFQNEKKELLNFVTENLLGESQQPSIRYQLEWLYILLVFNNSEDSLETNIWKALTQASCERLGSVCSFISIAYHIIKLKKDEYLFEQFIENVLPWCMSQNFNIRLYAQVTLKKLWPLFEEISVKYNILTKNQWTIYQQGNMLLNSQKLEKDFYLDCFHPIEHYSLQSIFWDLPRLSNISSDEWISLSSIKEKITNKPPQLMWGDEKSESSSVLSQCLVSSWVIKSEGNSENEESSSIQRKFTPWRGMFPQELESNFFSKKKGDLILVASLIDKTSNLGGLARTCDVFGVKELVLDSLNFVNDKQFKSLSMTAEKHVNITEVKAFHLSNYVSEMKKIGYIAVGAEQTTGSVSLCDYKFNKKTLLILGSEREGIPVNILPFLDVCIEIPQYGLIRSLNVHVTGAIFLWEYAKQHYQEKTI